MKADDGEVKLAVYSITAKTGQPPPARDLAAALGADLREIRKAYARLAQRRLLVLEKDGETIRMAPPFSGVPTQHSVRAHGVSYFANCAWDALGIPAALHHEAEVISRCEQTHEPLVLQVDEEGPEPSDFLFHCAVPASQWWKDIVFT
jgi:alkylmercury lyase-like protein